MENRVVELAAGVASMYRDPADAARERHLRLTKPGCRKDRDGPGYGPYWYLYYTNEKTGRYTSRYEGKTLRPELAEEFGLPPGSTAVREDAEDQGAGDRHRDPVGHAMPRSPSRHPN